MKKLSLLMAGLLLMCGQAYGANKVYPLGLGYTHGIVADSEDWTCTVATATSQSDEWLGRGLPYIKGKAKSLPIEFYFFSSRLGQDSQSNSSIFNSTWASQHIKSMLLECAYKTNTVFNISNFKGEARPLVVEGAYFDNTASGFFAFYVQPYSTKSLVMFIKIQGGLLDEQTRENLCKKAFALITPLVS